MERDKAREHLIASLLVVAALRDVSYAYHRHAECGEKHRIVNDAKSIIDDAQVASAQDAGNVGERQQWEDVT